MPESDSTATSVVPPPMSTTIEPVGSWIGRPAPIAAAIGSSIRPTRRAPAFRQLSLIARRSTAVAPDGTQTITFGIGEALAVVNLADEVLDHLLGDFEVGDDAVAHGADGLHVAGRAAEHLLGLDADGVDDLAAADVAQGDHGGFVQHDALALHVDEGVGGAEIDGDVV